MAEAAVAAEVPDRDSEVPGQAAAWEDREAERDRAGAAARVRAEVCGKRERPRVEAVVEEVWAVVEVLEARVAVEGEQAPVAAARVKEPVVEESLVDLDRAGLVVVDPEAVARVAVVRVAAGPAGAGLASRVENLASG